MAVDPRWLLLIHQLASRPGYSRVKVWRRLQRMGAVAVRGSVYVLPRTDACLEDFQWLAREISGEGADAAVCVASFVEGLSDADVEGLFRAARDADYAALAEEARALRRKLPRGGAVPADVREGLAVLRRRLGEIVAIDFFAAPGREAAEEVLGDLDARLGKRAQPAPKKRGEFHGRTWTTRRGIHVDRMACAWLIRRFIDPAATFRFVARGDPPLPGELRFDMADGEYTHEGDRCSFETVLHRFAIDDAALTAIGEIIHDIDLKDDKFARPETVGIAFVVAGIAKACDDDHDRLARASAILDDLHASFATKRPSPQPRPPRRKK